jgi:hypothetical protein
MNNYFLIFPFIVNRISHMVKSRDFYETRFHLFSIKIIFQNNHDFIRKKYLISKNINQDSVFFKIKQHSKKSNESLVRDY